MLRSIQIALGLACFTAFIGGQASATPAFVGSFQVDQGPLWGTNPISYSAQDAAALIFGGSATDYSISIDPSSDPSTITFTGWYSIWGIEGGTAFNQDYVLQTGTGYNDPGGTGTAASAYVWDNAQGPTYTNYVWTADAGSAAPEPGTYVLMGAGLLSFAGLRRRFRK